MPCPGHPGASRDTGCPPHNPKVVGSSPFSATTSTRPNAASRQTAFGNENGYFRDVSRRGPRSLRPTPAARASRGTERLFPLVGARRTAAHVPLTVISVMRGGRSSGVASPVSRVLWVRHFEHKGLRHCAAVTASLAVSYGCATCAPFQVDIGALTPEVLALRQGAADEPPATRFLVRVVDPSLSEQLPEWKARTRCAVPQQAQAVEARRRIHRGNPPARGCTPHGLKRRVDMGEPLAAIA